MKIAINQPYFFPYLGYFQLIASVDVFVAYGNVDYVHKSWISRNRMQGRSSAPYYISLPTDKASRRKTLAEVRFTEDARGAAAQLYRRLKTDYGRAPHAPAMLRWLKDLLKRAPYTSLQSFNVFALREVCQLLGIDTRIINDDCHLPELESSLRTRYEDNPSRRRRERILAITRREGARVYRNLPGGQALYDSDKFSMAGVELEFIAPPALEYPQFDGAFSPYLSILDVLMHCGVKETSRLVSSYRLLVPELQY